MKLRIQSAPNCTHEELRALLIDAAEDLVGENSHLLESKLPWDGYPILLADSRCHPVLVSFDNDNSQAALLNGLGATEQLAVALPWVNQVYEDLKQQQKAPKLVVVSHEPPPGGEAVLAGCPMLKLFTYKVLRVNGDTGVWLQRCGQENGSTELTDIHAATPKAVTGDIQTPVQIKATENTPSLSEEERAYFQQL